MTRGKEEADDSKEKEVSLDSDQDELPENASKTKSKKRKDFADRDKPLNVTGSLREEEDKKTDLADLKHLRSSMIWDFSVHGKLYCRSEEKKELLNVYRRVKKPSSKTELVLISGDTGVGKTALVQSIRSIVLEDGGYFVSGKFDQLQRQEPHAAFVSAFTAFCTDILDRGEKAIELVKDQVNEAVGTEGKVLTDMIPELENILGEQEDLPEIGYGSEAVNRFKYVFRMFLGAVSSPEKPLVLFLDDLHWADEASLDLWTTIVSDSGTEGILFIGAYREDYESSTGNLAKIFSQLKADELSLTQIQLGLFRKDAVNEMLSDILRCDRQKTMPLSNIVCAQTHGNAFFVLEFLHELHEQDLLQFDKVKEMWVWDTQAIHIEFADVNDLIRSKIVDLNPKAQETLKIASCLGSKLDEDILRHLMNEPVFNYLQLAAGRGLLVYDQLHACYAFAHDAIQEVTYNLIPLKERDAFHYKIGRKLWKSFEVEELGRSIFVVVGQLMVGSSQISDQREQAGVARLCRSAGMHAVKLSSFQTAYSYLMHGISLLGPQKWKDDYELTLDLHNAAAEVAYCIGQFDNVIRLVEETFKNARSFGDTLRGQGAKVYALGSSGRMHEAVKNGLMVLKELGEEFPTNPTVAQMMAGFKKTTKKLKGRSYESLLRLPNMNNPEKLAAMQMLNLIFLYAYMVQIELSPLIGFRMVTLTLDYGLCGVSCLGFVVYAMILCGVGNDIDEGYSYGKLAFKICEKFKAKAWLGRLSAGYYGCVHAWKRPIQETLEPMKHAYRIGLEAGDIEFAMLNANLYCWNQLDITPIPKLDKEIRGFCDRMKFYHQDMNLMLIKPTCQMLQNLMGLGTRDVLTLTGEIMQEDQLDQMRKTNESVYVWSCFHRMMLGYLFGDYDRAEALSSGCRRLVEYPFGATDVVVVVFFDGLTALAQARKSPKHKRHVAHAKETLKRITFWAKHSPFNFLGKQFLLEAELAVVTGDHFSAFSKYTCAIALSREGGFLMQTALANERLGKYFLERGDKESAGPFIAEALELYGQWGATTKVEHLKEETKASQPAFN